MLGESMVDRILHLSKILTKEEKKLIVYLFRRKYEYKEIIEENVKDKLMIRELMFLNLIEEAEIKPVFARRWYKIYTLSFDGLLVAQILECESKKSK